MRVPGKYVVRILLLEPSLSRRLRSGLLVRRHLRERRLHMRAGRELLIHLRGATVSRRVRRSESDVRRHLCGRHVRLCRRKQLPFSLRERPLPHRLSGGVELFLYILPPARHLHPQRQLSSITSIGGQPTISGGHYYLNDHGSLIAVTKAAYERTLVLQQRIFTLGPSVFFALGVLVHYPRRAVGGGAVAHV